MSANLTRYALSRVLEHLSEDIQAPDIRLFNDAKVYLAAMDAYILPENFQGRAQARVIVKRLLRAEGGAVEVEWQAAKDGEL